MSARPQVDEPTCRQMTVVDRRPEGGPKGTGEDSLRLRALSGNLAVGAPDCEILGEGASSVAADIALGWSAPSWCRDTPGTPGYGSPGLPLVARATEP